MPVSLEWKRRLTIIGIAVGVFAGYRYLLPVAIPFLLAWMFAGWLYPITLKIERRTKIKKSVAGAVLLTALFGVLGGLLYLGMRELLRQLKPAVSHLPQWLVWGEELLKRCCVLLEEVTGISRDSSEAYILEQLSGMQEHLLTLVGAENLVKIVSLVKGLVIFFSGIVVVYISTILILQDMEALRGKIRDHAWMNGIHRAAIRLKKTTVTYMIAQLLLMGLVAAVCTVGFWFMGSPYFLILGLALGVLDALPIIGTGTFLYPAAVFFLLKGNGTAAAGCVALDLVTSILREFLEPRLLGGRLGISPIAVVASVYIGVFLFGGFGVFLGPLAFSTAYELGKEWELWD